MKDIFKFTIKEILKNRTFVVIVASSGLYIFVPVLSFLSMREIKETIITLSLTLNSFIFLLLSVLGGISTIWHDIEKKRLYTLLSQPIGRTSYFLGRFLGFSSIMVALTTFNFIATIIISLLSYKITGDQVMPNFFNIFLAFFFSVLKFILVMSFGFLFSTFSTTFFMPFFATIFIFILGNASQGIYDFVILSKDIDYPKFFKLIIEFIHLWLPNLSSFDFTIAASYNLLIDMKTILLTLIYFFAYLTIVLSFSLVIFNKKDIV